MREYPDYHRRFFDGGDNLELATTHATLNINIENAPEQACPAQPRRHAVRVFVCGLAGILWRARHDRGTQSSIGRQHAVKADQVQARSRHQRGQAPHEFQR